MVRFLLPKARGDSGLEKRFGLEHTDEGKSRGCQCESDAAKPKEADSSRVEFQQHLGLLLWTERRR